MREMKDSGIEWIGKIPKEWKTKKLKMIYSKSNAGEVIDKGYWNVGKELLYTCQRTPMMSDYDKFPDFKRTTDSDLLLTRNATPYIFIPEPNAIYSNVIQRIVISEKYDRKFICYALQCGIDALIVQGNTIPSYNMQIWDNVFIPDVPFNIERKISAYLDNKCTKIDTIIAKQQKIIEKLKEYKISLITETVTKGLNPDVKMKDSGVEWIGKIPEHWKVTKFKYFSLEIGDGIHTTPEYDSAGTIYFVNGNNIGLDNLIFKDNTNKINEKEYKNYKLPLLTTDTILITLNGATYGKTSFYYNEKILLGKSAGYITLKTTENKRFVRYYLQSNVAKLIMKISLLGSTIANLSLNTLKNFSMPYPSKSEQQEIADYLDKKCSAIDSAIEKKQAIIEKLKEYKKSLIYEVVTGKKKL